LEKAAKDREADIAMLQVPIHHRRRLCHCIRRRSSSRGRGRGRRRRCRRRYSC
jgi:hypothetical protein